MGPSAGNADQIAYWNAKAADTWTALQDRTDALFAGLTHAAIDRLAPRPGDCALDIGCGCGATVLDLARRVGEQGKVLGLDVSAAMVARARERISAAGLINAEVELRDAASIKLLPVTADLVFSRFGVMFFADPTAAFMRLREVMKPGGRMLFVAWRRLDENPWFAIPLEAGRPLLPEQPHPEPGLPGPFAFADRDRVTALLTKAGWRDISVTREDVELRLAGQGSLDDAAHLAMSIGPLARALGGADPVLREKVGEAVRQALAPYDTLGGIKLGASVWFVSARV